MRPPLIKEQDESLVVTLRWLSYFYVALGLMLLVPILWQFTGGYFAKALVILGLRPGVVPQEPVSVLFIAFIGLVLLLFEYYILCRTVNRTTITIGPDLIRVRHGPLPWPWERGGSAPLSAATSLGLASRVERKSALAGRGSSQSQAMPFFRAELNLEGQPKARLALTPWLEDREPVEAVLEATAARLGLPRQQVLRKDR